MMRLTALLLLALSGQASAAGNYRISPETVEAWLQQNPGRSLATPHCETHPLPDGSAQLRWQCPAATEMVMMRVVSAQGEAQETRQWARGCSTQGHGTLDQKHKLVLQPNNHYRWQVFAYQISAELASHLCPAQEFATDGSGRIVPAGQR